MGKRKHLGPLKKFLRKLSIWGPVCQFSQTQNIEYFILILTLNSFQSVL